MRQDFCSESGESKMIAGSKNNYESNAACNNRPLSAHVWAVYFGRQSMALTFGMLGDIL